MKAVSSFRTSIRQMSCLLLLLSASAHAEDACQQAINSAQFVDAATSCKIAAANGDVNAAFTLAKLYAQGKGVAKSPEISVEWLTQAARYGHAEAQYNLGVAYSKGVGVGQDVPKAIEWYQSAFEAGITKAARNLAILYEGGEGSLSPDNTKSAQWYLKAADAGNVDSQVKVGVFFLEGKYLPQDAERAKLYLSRAASSDNATAMYALGMMMLEDKPAESFNWFSQAAERLHPMSTYEVAKSYLRGRGVKIDPDKAHAFAMQAEKLGVIQAKELVAEARAKQGASFAEKPTQFTPPPAAKLEEPVAVVESPLPKPVVMPQPTQVKVPTPVPTIKPIEPKVSPAIVVETPKVTPSAGSKYAVVAMPTPAEKVVAQPVVMEAPKPVMKRPVEQPQVEPGMPKVVEASVDHASMRMPSANSVSEEVELSSSQHLSARGGKIHPSANTTVSLKAPPPASIALHSEGDWLLSQPEKNFTVQLGALTNPSEVRSMVNEYKQLPIHIVASEWHSREVWLLLYGSYKTAELAHQAMEVLPLPIRKQLPWVRSFQPLQTLHNILEKRRGLMAESPTASKFASLDTSHCDQDSEWLKRQNADVYTLQLAVMSQMSSVKELMEKYQLDSKACVAKVRNSSGASRYVVTLGAYPDYTAAQQAMAALPVSLRDANPWPRPFGQIQATSR